jgi:hypothetical protein
VVLQYLGGEERREFDATLPRAGEESSDEAPLAWLRMEPPDWRRSVDNEVRLTTWPGGEDVLLAWSGPHGRPVRWLAGVMRGGGQASEKGKRGRGVQPPLTWVGMLVTNIIFSCSGALSDKPH